MKTPAPCRAQPAQGFTLVELLVTLALLSVLLTLAVPSFQAFRRNSELTSAANSFVAVLALARGEAMKRGATTVVVPADGSNWARGWTAFVDKNLNNSNDSTDEVLATRLEGLPSYLAMTKNHNSFVRFNGSGFSVNGSGFQSTTIHIAANDATGDALLAQTRRIKLSSTGRVRVCTPKSATDPDCLQSTDD